MKPGKSAEILAQEVLSQRGYQILTVNFTCKGGEIDIIAQHGEFLCFIEVKSRTNTTFGLPQESIGYSKRQRMITAAKRYLQTLKAMPMCRFDVVSIYPTQDNPVHIEIIAGAFTL